MTKTLPVMVASLLMFLAPSPARACSCAWSGSFLTVAPQAELVIRAKILSHHGKKNGVFEKMKIKVLETYKGSLWDREIFVWGDEGWLCRAPVAQFPVHTEWILALNGPGSKPEMSPGPSISSCGQYWLEVKGGEVQGSIEGKSEPPPKTVSQLMNLTDFVVKFRKELAP